MNYTDIIEFWFQDIEKKMWWQKDEAFDQLIADKFSETHRAASLGELFSWREEPLGCVAEVIVLDQFSRNMYRNKPMAFSQDPMALALAQEAIRRKIDEKLEREHKVFLYMPFMHSESLLIHEQAVQLFSTPGVENNLDFEKKHKVIIERFGRYPHRNEILGRPSTPEELEFLQGPNSSF